MVFGRCLQTRDVELYSACQEAVRHTQEQNAVLVAESQRYYQALRDFFTAETEASIIAPLTVIRQKDGGLSLFTLCVLPPTYP